MTKHAPLLLAALLVAACTPAPPGTPAASASPGASAAPSAAPSAGPSMDPREIVPGTLRDAVPITYTLKVDGKPAEMDALATYNNAPGSDASLFWTMGVFATTGGKLPAGALKLGRFAVGVHIAPGAAAPTFFRNARTLTDAEFQSAVKFTLREGAMNGTVLVAREWYGDFRTPGGISGSLKVDGGQIDFAFKGKLPEDKYNGGPHEVEFSASGLPKP